MDYFVSWEIEVKAENPVEAAKLARGRPNHKRRLDPTVFSGVRRGAEDAVRVDLSAISEEYGPHLKADPNPHYWSS